MNSRVSYLTVDLRNAINHGIAKGPRLQVAGPAIDPRAGNAVQTPSEITADAFENDLMVNSPDDARRAVRKLKAYGTDFVKIYATQDFVGDEFHVFMPNGKMVNSPSLTLGEIQAAVNEAHRLGLKVACHAYGGEGLHSCITAGVDIPMHGPEVTDEEIQLMVKNKQMFGITIDDLINLDPGDKKITGGKVSRLSLTESAFKRAHAAHIPLPFGSGRSSATEGQMAIGGEAAQFSWMTKWGMTPAEALQTAFMVAANSLNYDWGTQIGSVEKGKFADIIAVSGNPLTDITEMERVKFVMKGGEVFRNDLAGRARRDLQRPDAERACCAISYCTLWRNHDSLEIDCAVGLAALVVASGVESAARTAAQRHSQEYLEGLDATRRTVRTDRRPRRPIVRQQVRPDAGATGRAHSGRPHHRRRCGRADRHSRRRPGDRSESGHGDARLYRRP